MTTFLFKLILSPLLIGAVSVLGRRWGPAISGWLIGLPLTSGPVILFLALDQGTPFAAAASQAIVLGITSVGLFCLTYSRLARRWGWPPTLLAGWGMVLLSTLVLQQIVLPPALTFVVVVVVLAGVLRLMPQAQGVPPPPLTPRWEIPVRMLLATGFVVLLTGLAQVLGPHLSGLLAPFPLFATILAVFTHHFQGGIVAGNLLRGVVLGTFSFVGFFLVVALLLQTVGIALTFLCASGAALLVQGATLWLLHRSPLTPPPVVPEA